MNFEKMDVARRKYEEAWSKMEPYRAIVEIYQLHMDGREDIGLTPGKFLVDEIAELLQLEKGLVQRCIRKLRSLKTFRVTSDGQLQPYIRCFEFPDEIKAILITIMRSGNGTVDPVGLEKEMERLIALNIQQIEPFGKNAPFLTPRTAIDCGISLIQYGLLSANDCDPREQLSEVELQAMIQSIERFFRIIRAMLHHFKVPVSVATR